MFSEGSHETEPIPYYPERRHYNSPGSSEYPNLNGNSGDCNNEVVWLTQWWEWEIGGWCEVRCSGIQFWIDCSQLCPLNSPLPPTGLCEVGQVASPPWALFYLSVKWRSCWAVRQKPVASSSLGPPYFFW